MKVLYLAHRLPYPPNKGEKIRVFNQIRQLARKHMIHLCSFVDDAADLPHTKSLKDLCASVEIVRRNNITGMTLAVRAFIQNDPLSVRLFYRKAFATLIQKKLEMERFDCIIVSCSSMAQYVSSGSGIPKIIDFIDVDSEKWRMYSKHCAFPLSFIYRREAARLARYEAEITAVFDHSIFSSRREAETFRKLVKEQPLSVITNGVDLDFFSPSSMKVKNGGPIIVFTGVMDYFPNVDAVKYFYRAILPLVVDSVPNAQFSIVGSKPTRQVKALRRSPNVRVTGAVSDVRPYLANARVAVAPFRLARGVQNKVLEAMAMGLPVVGTSETFEGISANEADGIRIADDPKTFANCVISLLRCNEDLRRKIGKQARGYVERHHRWEDQGAELERILTEVVSANASPRSKTAVLA